MILLNKVKEDTTLPKPKQKVVKNKDIEFKVVTTRDSYYSIRRLLLN